MYARRLAKPTTDKMASYRRVLGVTPDTIGGIEAFTAELIARLDTHLRAHDYLLGGRPCIGDFALYGPLWAHMFRDPGTTGLFEDAPAVQAWFERLAHPPEHGGEFLAGDEIPETLDPIFRTLFDEQWPYVRAIFAAMERWCADNPDAHRVPRSLGDHPFVIGGHAGVRRLLTFTAWMAQRPLDAWAALSEVDLGSACAWLARLRRPGVLDVDVRHRQERRSFRMRLAGSQ